MHKNIQKMPKNIQKTIQSYISKIKKQAPHLQISHSSISHTTSKLLSGCKHPKSLSYDFESKHKHENNNNNDEAATLEDIDKFLMENFKSLYEDDQKLKEKEKYPRTESGSSTTGVVYDDSPRFFTPSIDLSNGSYRYFASQASSGSETRLSGSVGTSTSASDEAEAEASSEADAEGEVGSIMLEGMKESKSSSIPEGIEDCIAVLTVSPSPFEDFKRSMVGVLEARINHNQKVDWDFMQELLFCYLRLNEKKQYRFILSAFVDLVVVLRQNSSGNGDRRPDVSRGSDGGSGDNNGDVKGKKKGGY